MRILRSANALIAQQSEALRQALWSDLGNGDTIRVTPAADDEAEAEMVVRRIAAHASSSGARSYSDFAILYRGNHQAQVFETALRAQGIAYDISGGQSMFERTEIKDIVAYLRLIANDDDDPAFLRAVTTPKRGVGADHARATRRHRGARARRASSRRRSRPSSRRACPARQREALREFCTLDQRPALPRRARARGPPARRAPRAASATRRGSSTRSTSAMRSRAARACAISSTGSARKGEADDRNLLELTQTMALITMLENRDGEGVDAVRLSTLHAAKGLEFPHVFIVGLEEGILPHRESIDAGDVDEERRLMYVGVTRAQQSLHLSWCRARKRAGETRRLPAVALHRRARAGGPALLPTRRCTGAKRRRRR